ncbi:MAG: hypothetical protein QM723_34270 [Myxococcaceae bacterium]
MRGRFQHLAASAIGLSEADERAASVVVAAAAKTELLQVLVELVEHVVVAPKPTSARRHDEVFTSRLAVEERFPAGQMPVGENLREGGVNGHLARLAGLHFLLDLALRVVRGGDDEPAERLGVSVVAAPTKRRDFPGATPAEKRERVEHASIERNARVRNHRFDFGAREHRSGAPARVLVDLLRQLAALEHTGVGQDELIRLGLGEHRVKRSVDVAHGARCELLALSPNLRLQLSHQVTHLARADFRKE